ncbi:winged helix-turn-helix transcriptional regulator [Candidatus Bathyarchaeota archaeon]|nr:winged helix-turn-helix transcriptional regulator [Candidatus Bathyarchaeota archaeon]
MKFRSEKLDKVDNTILGMLVEDSRTTLASISEEVGLSSPAIRERINKLKEEGVIKGFSTIVDYKKLGYGLTAFIGLRMDDSKCCQEDVFVELENVPEVLEAHFTNGEEDVLVKVVSRDTESLVGLLGELNAIDSVNRTRTLIALKTPIERNLR